MKSSFAENGDPTHFTAACQRAIADEPKPSRPTAQCARANTTSPKLSFDTSVKDRHPPVAVPHEITDAGAAESEERFSMRETLKGPTPHLHAPVQSFVNRAGTTWELGSRLQQPERKRRRFNLAARRSLTLSGTLRVCWPNEWPLFVSFLPPLYFLCQESETAALMMCVCVCLFCGGTD